MKVVCFDLDDTLHKEIEYLKAAYRLIAHEVFGENWKGFYHQMLEWYVAKKDVFENVVKLAPEWKKNDLLDMYRYGVHELFLSKKVEKVLSVLKNSGIMLGLITDGRSQTQRNKIEALKLGRFFNEDMIIISEEFGSEKPSLDNYEYFMWKFPDCKDFSYVGDNLVKDFIAPNILGWMSICLKDSITRTNVVLKGNIHSQDLSSINKEALPKRVICSLEELISR